MLELTDAPMCGENCTECTDEFKVECCQRAHAAYQGEPFESISPHAACGLCAVPLLGKS